MTIRCFLIGLMCILYAPLVAQNNVDKLFILGNSTIDHRPPAIETPSDETTVPHWVYLLAEEANDEFAAGGQYGFLSNFDDLSWFSQWGYDIVPGVWESDYEPFSDADITAIMLTTANFIQYQPAHLPYPLDESTTVLEATETVFDYADDQEPGMKYYLYQNWPEMDLMDEFPPNIPTDDEIEDYHNETTGSFHDWWLEYQDSLLVSRPDLNVRLIPVGSILSKILRDLIPGEIPFDELYEDSAPHGRASLYFLAGLITYMGLYEVEAPESYVPDPIVHQAIIDDYQLIADFIWNELTLFNDDNGDSRVFCNNVINDVDALVIEDDIHLFPNPTEGLFTISGMLSDYQIEILDVNGSLYELVETDLSLHTIDLSDLPAGIFYLKIVNVDNGQVSVEKILKTE